MDAKSILKKKIRWYEYITIAWNFFEGSATIIAGIVASSISLIGFGLSSGLEVFAGIVVLWEMGKADRSREKVALRLIGSGYFIVAAFIIKNAFSDLLQHHHSLPSIPGIILLSVTVLIMLFLAFQKSKLGKELGSATVIAEANYSLIDGSLAAIVLGGLILNELFGLWWADGVMALLIALFAIKEGIEEWKESLKIILK